MNPSDSLQLVVEASLALAGFAGVITALTRRGAHALLPLQRLNLVNLLSTSLGALFLSLAALVMLAAEIDPAFVWRVISGVGLAVTLYFSAHSIRTVLSTIRESHRQRARRLLLSVNLPLLAVCVAQVWNTAVLAAFWPVLLLLVALFGIGCYAFVRFLFDPTS